MFGIKRRQSLKKIGRDVAFDGENSIFQGHIDVAIFNPRHVRPKLETVLLFEDVNVRPVVPPWTWFFLSSLHLLCLTMRKKECASGRRRTMTSRHERSFDGPRFSWVRFVRRRREKIER